MGHFKTSLSEHDRSGQLGYEDSSFSNHLKTYSVTDCDSNVDFKILHINPKGIVLNSLEMLEIKRLVYEDSKLIYMYI